MKKKYFTILLAALIILFQMSCEHASLVPKPNSYPRIIFKPKIYCNYQNSQNFTFRYPNYASVTLDSSEPNNNSWYNILFPDYNAKIHLSYGKIYSDSQLLNLENDAKTFAYNHSIRADDILKLPFRYNKSVSGMIYKIEGNTASSVQFFATDSTKNYLRGALYFNSHPNKDSLEPVIRYLSIDIDTLLRSLRWK